MFLLYIEIVQKYVKNSCLRSDWKTWFDTQKQDKKKAGFEQKPIFIFSDYVTFNSFTNLNLGINNV